MLRVSTTPAPWKRPPARPAVRVGVFGGSFDPVHNGHLRAARLVADRLNLDQVRWIPARDQPFKSGRHIASPTDRVAMLRIALGDAPDSVLDHRELHRSGPSYTVDTLRELATEFPDDRLFLLLGADAAREFPAWREANDVARLAHVVAFTRAGALLPDHPLIGTRLNVPALEISATAIRDAAARGESVGGAVPVGVARYIWDHHLYGSEG